MRGSRKTRSQATAPEQSARDPTHDSDRGRAPESPLDYMLRVMRDERAEPARRDAMARAALPYLHVKPKTLDPAADAEPETPPMSRIELARRVAFLLNSGEEDEGQ